ncbi:glutamyl aminopeptidase-like [Liolophura sinensis]|uniref:glutamyl aminopeptidase-like n=1 Tax=Liolophura sinensis TaxID=3198878 RepID=UPI00315973A9
MHRFDVNPSKMDGESKKVSFNKRCCYLLAFLFIGVPVVTGVLVWYFLPKCGIRDGESVTDESSGGRESTTEATPSSSTGPIPGKPWTYLRLPTFIRPLHYDLTLYPDFYEDHGWFYGNETIEIEIRQDTRFILIHYNQMNMTRTELFRHDTTESIPIKRTFSYSEHQFWVVETESVIPAGSTVDLELQFDGSLTNSIVGFYKSTYVNSQTNQTRHLATSKFEPVDARKAFPCFDEPNIKANFTVTLVHRPNYTALSNMPDETTTAWSDGDLLATRFRRSVPMSTYLVCFIVCDFLQLNMTTNEGTLVRVWATPDKIEQTRYALALANNTMSLYERKFNLPYPLPKQDMIAIPDFVSGAMEHWGLITYRETYMLLDENEASSSNKQRVATVVAHELAHQWFGNIVTMDWWDDLWLNEGFASFMEYIGVADYEKDWHMMNQFIVDDVQPVMVTDSAVNSHPIVVKVNNPDEINEVFDSISYSKGASIIGMLKHFMGDDKFFEGIQMYLQRFQWGNAKTDDLWNSLSNVTGAPDVKRIMDTWTLQMGLPYINITIEVTNGETRVVGEQERFLQDPNADPTQSEYKSPFNYTWFVPLEYRTQDNSTVTTVWMNMTDVSFAIPLDLTNPANWVKFNVGQTGFYRINYPVFLWRKFADILDNNLQVIPDVDRAGLLSDAFDLARAGLLGYDAALNLTGYLHKEESYLAWDSVSSGLSYISHMLETTEHFGLWTSYVLSKSKPVMDRLGWEDTGPHLKKLLRSTIISMTCSLGDTECRQNATTKFINWVQSGRRVKGMVKPFNQCSSPSHNYIYQIIHVLSNSVPPNLRSYVYQYGIEASSNTEDWDFMWRRYMAESVPQERSKLLTGMAQTEQIWLIYRLLKFAMDESKVRSQDFFYVLSYLSGNMVAKPILWRWFQEHWEALVSRFSLRSRSLGRAVGNIVSTFNTEFQLDEVLTFFKKYPDAGAGSRGRLQAVDRIKSNIQWMEKNKDGIVQWLKNQGQ